MKPIKFPEQNVTFAGDQPEYKKFPAYKCPNDREGLVVFCWQPTFKERFKILFGSNIYVGLLTFNQELQPILVGTSFDEVN